MKTLQDKIRLWWRPSLLLLIATLVIAACGGNQPAATPEAAPATEAATETPEETPASDAESQSESPLVQSESPLSQPESPLTTFEGKPANVEQAVALAASTAPPEATGGNGSISTVIYSFGRSPGVVPETTFYLVEAVELEGNLVPPPIYTGPDVAGGDIYGTTSPTGQIQIGDIPPGDYYLAVWTLYGWLLAFPVESADGSPFRFNVEENSQQNLGVLYVDWP